MKISELLKGIKVKDAIDDIDISDVTADTRKITPGCAFVCIKGEKFDGHSAALSALENGAAIVIAQRDTGAQSQIIVKDTRRAYSIMCANFYGNPSQRLKLIGITGTNGKTTTAFLVKGILDNLGKRTGLIGTVKNMIDSEELEAHLTTPECKDLQELFLKMADSGCEYCVMEVSSQALAQSRVDGCRFAVGIFTNLTQDHLDYHGTMENYAAAKAKLFSMSDISVLNLDDKMAGMMARNTKGKIITYSAKSDSAEYTARDVSLYSDHIEYELTSLWAPYHVSLPIPGDFTVYNSLAAAAGVAVLGYPLADIASALKKCRGVCGRIEVVPTNTPYTVIIDYAHSPDGLENIIKSLRRLTNGRIITVFGCGGDRDKTKRPIMGMVAAKLSDVIVVTSDNPRTEDPEKIIEDILEGVRGIEVEMVVESDRTRAIEIALNKALPGDIVLLAGKGHETYQILNTGTIHYDEREVVASILSR